MKISFLLERHRKLRKGRGVDELWIFHIDVLYQNFTVCRLADIFIFIYSG
jgi:hypothetical protein